MEKTWRLSKNDYEVMAKEISSKKESVDDWAEISLSGELSKEELMCRIMMDNDPNRHAGERICQLYMCESYKMDEEFLRDVIYVNSGLALIGCWDNKVVNWVLDLHAKLLKKSGGASIGNALKAVKKAVESGKFSYIPEYDAWLKSFMVEYYKLKENIMSFKMPETDDEEKIADALLEISVLAGNLKNYAIEIHDRLDWIAIERLNDNLSYDFLDKHSKKPNYGGSNSFRDEDDDIISVKPINRTKKYTAKRAVRKVRDKVNE